MRILVLSDLHLEWGPFEVPAPALYDAVVLAGDICKGPQAVEWAQKSFAGTPVVLVPGNHEFYRLELEQALETMRERSQGTNVHVLDRDEIVLRGPGGDAVRFLGTTLWTDFGVAPDVASAMDVGRRGMNDFAGLIQQRYERGKRRFQPEDSVVEHGLSRRWLQAKLDAAAPDLPTMVVTHHGPSHRSIAPKFEGHPLNPCFVSELPESFFDRNVLWIHGHVHNTLDYRLGNDRVVANPRGQHTRDRNENEAFDLALVIEMPGSADCRQEAS